MFGWQGTIQGIDHGPLVCRDAGIAALQTLQRIGFGEILAIQTLQNIVFGGILAIHPLQAVFWGGSSAIRLL